MSTGLYVKRHNLTDNVSLKEVGELRYLEGNDGEMHRHDTRMDVLVFKTGGHSRFVNIQDNGDIYISVGYKAVAELCYDLDQAGVAWEEIG